MPRRPNNKTPRQPLLKRLNRSGLSRVGLLLVLLVWLGIIGLLAHNRQNIIDWWRLRHYQAPAAVAQLVTQDTMTAYARKIFYVNHPNVESKATFNAPCPNNGGEQTIVLGCYHSDQSGIYLLSVTDRRLNGVQQVTAAHEMLHAAYDRLSGSERSKVDAMLVDYDQHDLHDPRLLATMAAYQKTEPHDVVNEMHSVFGTEIANLPAPLETYYARYFTNRQQITNYAASYQAEFTSRQATITADDAQLGSLKSQIDSGEADLKTKQTTITSQNASLLAERSSDPAAYNAGVPAYNSLIDAYNAEVPTIQAQINQYNQLVAARNAVAFEENQLSNDLSSTNVAPIKK